MNSFFGSSLRKVAKVGKGETVNKAGKARKAGTGSTVRKVNKEKEKSRYGREVLGVKKSN